MKKPGLPLLCLLLVSLSWMRPGFAIDPERLEDPAQQQRYEEIIRNIRCTQCQNESIADSNADLAGQFRAIVRDMVRQGHTNAEIYSFMTDRYTDFVLFRPPFKPTTWLLWVAPALLILIGGGTFAMILASRSAQPIDDDDDPVDGPGASGPAPSGGDMAGATHTAQPATTKVKKAKTGSGRVRNGRMKGEQA